MASLSSYSGFSLPEMNFQNLFSIVQESSKYLDVVDASISIASNLCPEAHNSLTDAEINQLSTAIITDSFDASRSFLTLAEIDQIFTMTVNKDDLSTNILNSSKSISSSSSSSSESFSSPKTLSKFNRHISSFSTDQAENEMVEVHLKELFKLYEQSGLSTDTAPFDLSKLTLPSQQKYITDIWRQILIKCAPSRSFKIDAQISSPSLEIRITSQFYTQLLKMYKASKLQSFPRHFTTFHFSKCSTAKKIKAMNNFWDCALKIAKEKDSKEIGALTT